MGAASLIDAKIFKINSYFFLFLGVNSYFFAYFLGALAIPNFPDFFDHSRLL